MPYSITHKNPDCSGWAVVDPDNVVFGCHQTKADAIKQAVAISLATDEPFVGERNADGPTVKISDIDGTLIQSGNRVEKVWEFLDEQPGALFIVTGRPESERDSTVAELADLDIEYSRLIMNPGSTADSADYKKATAETLLETYNVTVAVENDADTLRAYASLGIEAVDPADIDTQDGEQVSAYRAGKLGTMGKVETREFTTTIELRAEGDGNTFSGYAALFNSPSEPLPFTEVIAPGAFTRSLKSRNDVKMLWNHDSGQVLASTRSGTLSLVEDERGLKVTAVLPDTTAGRDARELISKGIVDAMSFGFSVPSGGDSWSSDGNTRTLKSVRLHEVSVVAWPAYSATGGTVSVRKLDGICQRAEVDADALQDVLTRIENGAETISPADRALVEKVLEHLSPAAEADEILGDLALLELKKKKLNLLEMQ